MDFSESCWEHIRVDAQSDTEGSVGSAATQSDQGPQNLGVLYKQAKDIKKRLDEESFTTSVKKFAATYHKLSSKPRMLHQFCHCSGLNGAMVELLQACKVE